MVALSVKQPHLAIPALLDAVGGRGVNCSIWTISAG